MRQDVGHFTMKTVYCSTPGRTSASCEVLTFASLANHIGGGLWRKSERSWFAY